MTPPIEAPASAASSQGHAAALAGWRPRRADVVIMAIGEAGDMSGEAMSRSSLDLPGLQLDLVKAVQAARIAAHRVAAHSIAVSGAYRLVGKVGFISVPLFIGSILSVA